MLVLLINILVIMYIDGFLLENHQNNGNQTSIEGQYLTVSSFLEEKDMLKQEAEQIKGEASRFRHDVNQKLSILSSQLKEKFDELDKREAFNTKPNETTSTLSELEKNYSSLERKFHTLQKNHDELKQNYTLLFNTVQRNNLTTESTISDLKQLGSIKPLQEVANLKQTVISLQTQTHVLALKEQSRAQDFMALYNMTIQLQQQLNENSEQVVLTAYYTHYGTIPKGNGVIFNDVRQQIGITNTTNFRNSGKFTCEKNGIYLISASIMSYTSDAEMFIYRNNERIAHAELGDHPSHNWWHSGTAVVAQRLGVSDTIWVAIDVNLAAYGGKSCYLSIVKVQ